MKAPVPHRSKSNLGKDMAIFTDAGFLVTLALLVALFGLGTIILIYASEKYGIPVLRFSLEAARAVV